MPSRILTELKVRGFPIPSHWTILHPEDRGPSPIAIEFLAHLRVSAQPLTAAISVAAPG